MRNRYATGRRRAAAFSGLLTLALALALAASTGSAFCQDADEEDVPLDTKLFRNFMHELGFRKDAGAGIDYRERAPLVVPPSRDLPAPQAEGPTAQNPAWPKDPDAARRRNAAAAAEKAKLRSSNDLIDESRPLRPDELDKGGGGTTQTGRTQMPRTTEETARPLSPAELGQNKSLLEGMFSSIGPQRAESAPFTGEPPRTSMTAPPPGYQTPSPNYPYGVQPTQAAPKPQTLEQRLEPAR